MRNLFRGTGLRIRGLYRLADGERNLRREEYYAYHSAHGNDNPMPYEEWVALGKSLGIPARPWWLELIYAAVAIAMLLGIAFVLVQFA